MARAMNGYDRYLHRALLALGLMLLAAVSQAADKETVLVLRPALADFNEVIQGMISEMGDDLNFQEMNVDDKTDPAVIGSAMKDKAPKAIVLVGNSAINLYINYQKASLDAATPPAVALAASFVDLFIAKMRNSTGIRYEIPVVTSAVSMRSLLSSPLKKVGVVYRHWMGDIITEHTRYMKAENIELVGIELPDKDDDMSGKLKDALKSLADRKVDAIWMLNDNALLNPKTAGEVWQPFVKSTSIAMIVGVKNFVSGKIGLGSFAVVPDHYGLGVQAASMLSDIKDDDWQIGSSKVEQPLSVKKILNTKTLDDKGISYLKEKLGQVDEVIRE